MTLPFVPRWAAAAELRVGLGCMRLSSDAVDEEQAVATIAAAVAAGITMFDTAHAYGVGAEPLGENEALVARALTRSAVDGSARGS